MIVRHGESTCPHPRLDRNPAGHCEPPARRTDARSPESSLCDLAHEALLPDNGGAGKVIVLIRSAITGRWATTRWPRREKGR